MQMLSSRAGKVRRVVVRIVRYALMSIGICLVIGMTYAYTRTPRNDRAWDERFTRPTYVQPLPDGSVKMTDVRDWSYDIGTITGKDWRDMTVRPEDITKMWFVLEPFSQFEAVGHTFLIFEFKDGTSLAFSVEARSQVGQGYSAIAGQFNAYELSYTWGTERDFLARRVLFLEHPVRVYPLKVTPDLAAGMFRQLLVDTEHVDEHPRFYNTLTANCTNVLAEIINERYPNAIPYDLSWNFPGYSDRFLMSIGRIPLVEGSQEATMSHADITPFRANLSRAAGSSDPHAFGNEVRKILGAPALGSGK